LTAVVVAPDVQLPPLAVHNSGVPNRQFHHRESAKKKQKKVMRRFPLFLILLLEVWGFI
jgi:hypothetical protein